METVRIPRVKSFVAVSLDMKVTGFPIDLDQYYGLAATLGTDASISGSNTYIAGFKPFWRPEIEQDMNVKDDASLPYAFLVDSRGATEGLLHLHRSSGYCRDVVVLHAQDTPGGFIEYLDERKYPHHSFGYGRVDLDEALTFIKDHYGIQSLRVDSGGILISELFRQGLCHELILMIHPCIAGDISVDGIHGELRETSEGHLMTGIPRPLFTSGLEKIDLDLTESRVLSDGKILLHYSIL